ncbi:MAG: response regulator [Oligoflexales bacterium]|nr:response regulator [Oligoflexales bacterium]
MKKILIVDDSLTSRMFLKKCIQMATSDHPCEIIEAENGEDAFSMLGMIENIDLVVSDVNMPVMTGFTFLRNIKNTPHLAGLPVIFITSMASDSRVQNLMEIGAAGVIRKPTSPADVIKAISPYIGEEEKKNTDKWG